MNKILDANGLEFLIDRLHIKIHEELRKAVTEGLLVEGINNTDIVNTLNTMLDNGEVVTKESVTALINQAIQTATNSAVAGIKSAMDTDETLVAKISSVSENTTRNYLNSANYLTEATANNTYLKKYGGTVTGNITASGKIKATEIEGRFITESGVIFY